MSRQYENMIYIINITRVFVSYQLKLSMTSLGECRRHFNDPANSGMQTMTTAKLTSNYM